jgi:GNAT superfamily N-acetyltransferase
MPESAIDVAFQREQAAALWDEILPLLEAHWREITHYPDIALDVDRALYEKLDSMGMLRCFTARVDGRLVGYAAYLVKANLHYRQSLQANQDVLYLAPEYRRSRIGSHMLLYADEQLRAEGVQVVYQHTKLAHDIGPVLQRLGYEPVETIYAKRLDR